MNRFNPFVSPNIAVPVQNVLPVGYQGAGVYRVVSPTGLNLRAAPRVDSQRLQTISEGTHVRVADPAPIPGWVIVTEPQFGYMCMSCIQAPGGPWLVWAPSQAPITSGYRSSPIG